MACPCSYQGYFKSFPQRHTLSHWHFQYDIEARKKTDESAVETTLQRLIERVRSLALACNLPSLAVLARVALAPALTCTAVVCVRNAEVPVEHAG